MNTFPEEFKRLLSVNFYKNLQLPLAEMSFYKDWTKDIYGNPYPVLRTDGTLNEEVGGGIYSVSRAENTDDETVRFFFQSGTCATLEMKLEKLYGNGRYGFSFMINQAEIQIFLQSEECGYYICCSYGDKLLLRSDTATEFTPGTSLVVTHHGSHADIYVRNGALKLIGSLKLPVSGNTATIGLLLAPQFGGGAEISSVKAYLDCGISQADPRHVRYIDGTPYMENGRLMLTVSVRHQYDGYQAVLSWLPGTADFRLEGGLFFVYEDGMVSNDIASSILYDSENKQWLIWNCSFSHGHILSHGTCRGDVLHGLNIVDMQLMTGTVGEDRRVFAALEGDEDPDFLYDTANHRWLMSICRVNEEKHYRYEIFTSDKPFSDYRFLCETTQGSNTGGSFVRIEDKLYFIYGSDYKVRSKYIVHEVDDFSNLKQINFDYEDGGFRGWGTVMPVRSGSRNKYYWITFDRHCANPNYNWSYGNLYIFVAE